MESWQKQQTATFQNRTLTSSSTWIDLLGPFTFDQLQSSQQSITKDSDNVATPKDASDLRLYIDALKDVGSGKQYKGEWNKKTGEREGVGI